MVLQEAVQKRGITKQVFVTFCICMAIVIYFTFYTIFGNKGIIKYFTLRNQMLEKDSIKSELYNKIQTKQNLVKGMNLQSLDLDLLDEQARKNLGFANKDEIVLYNNDSPKK